MDNWDWSDVDVSYSQGYAKRTPKITVDNLICLMNEINKIADDVKAIEDYIKKMETKNG